VRGISFDGFAAQPARKPGTTQARGQTQRENEFLQRQVSETRTGIPIISGFVIRLKKKVSIVELGYFFEL